MLCRILKYSNLFIFFIALFISAKPVISQNDSAGSVNKYLSFKIKPSDTDPSIKNFDVPHFVQYDKGARQGKLLLFLSGTGGNTEKGPADLFLTAVEQGYRVINLCYIDTPAVWKLCGTKLTSSDPDCAENFRIKRIYGENVTSVIPDEPQDAIMNRFTKLLIYLAKFDKGGNWSIYLDNNYPKWDLIAIAGHSQGGSMAAFIAKKVSVARIISFSGGSDHGAKGKMADWFFRKSATPPERWYGIYHTQEPTAEEILKAFQALAIPEKQVYPFSSEVRSGKKPHGEAIWNPVYKPKWIEVFGKGT